MAGQFDRTELLLGEDAMRRLQGAKVALFGIGGVGGFVAEALIRAGVGQLDLYDHDVVSVTNLNRQIAALHSTLGLPKVDVLRQRLLDINPDARVGAFRMFYLPENADAVDLSVYDYVADCIDTVKAKIELAVRCQSLNVPLIASMGTGNKLDPTAFEVADLYSTSVCPLARVMRQELKKRGVHHLKVVYSREIPRKVYVQEPTDTESRRATPGSVSFCPSVAGLILAGEIIRDLANIR